MSNVLIAHSDTKEIRSTMLPSTILLHYNYEFTSITNILEKLLELTSRCPIRNLGLHIQSQSTNVLSLSGAEKSNVNRTALRESSNVRKFFRTLIQERFPNEGANIDFFLINPVQDQVGIGQAIQYSSSKQISVRFIQRFLNDNLSQSNRRIIEIYFNFDKLMRTKQDEQRAADKSRLPTQTSGYERIRVVGKGFFGMAILYRRKDDDSLVILKEINMHDLSSSERQLSLNEVSLLSRMDHPNIISYYDSFEEDGILMIEMEYAEGGNLAQFLARREDYMDEAEIMCMFEQMLSAVSYLHDNNVLHRDLKTANIFLTKDNLVKIGDFGISKMMGTETRFQGAQTVVGTPYYISPEMCEGKPYNEKSDIWALGCILYEMACLQKTFEGTSLPALVNKIVKGEYEQIKGPYSNDLKILVRDMLKVDPEQRPTAAQALEIVQRNRSLNAKRGRKKSIHRPGSDFRQKDCHSALYQFDIANVTLSAIASLGAKIKVKQIAVGLNHQVLLTMDSVVYSWGDNKFGQLGHGDRKSRNQPTRIEALAGKEISYIAVGTSFSVFCADRGIVMVCGHRKFTGNGKASDDWLKPRLVDSLLREDIIDLSCGYEHAAVVTEEGQVYVWGNGENGRLGTGKTEFVYTATKIDIPTRQLVINVRCGPDCTMLITSCGTIIAMGSNKYNKLNLNYRLGFFANVKHTKSEEIENILTPTAVPAFPSRVVDVSLGPNHSGVLLESGHVHLFGRNTYCELGTGNRQPVSFGTANRPVKALLCKACVQLICGNGFTMTATADNELYFWGSKGVVRKQEEITVEDLEFTRKSIAPGKEKEKPDTSDRSKSAKKSWHWKKNAEKDDGEAEEVIYQPTLVLRLDSTRNSSGTKPFIRLSALACFDKNVMVVIDTSPVWVDKDEEKTKLSSAKTPRPWGKRRRSAPELHSADDSLVPTWVQNEFAEAEVLSTSKLLPGSTMSVKTKDATGNHMTFTQAARLQGTSLMTEKQLRTDIENLKKQLQEQKSTFKGHEDQMKLLQKKLAELQAIQKQNFERPNEPPPAYPKSATSRSKSGTGKPRIIKNPFIPEAQTKVCNIL